MDAKERGFRRYYRSLRPLGRVGKSIEGPDSGAEDEADDGSPASGGGDSQVRREAMGHGQTYHGASPWGRGAR